MKCSRSHVRRKAHAVPNLKFEDQTLTSFAGLVIFQKFFMAMELKTRLSSCFRHVNGGKIFDRATVFLQLIVHLLLGFRELQDCRYYRDDPLVKRLLGLKQLPDAATLSRMLKQTGAKSVESLRRVLREMVLDRLRKKDAESEARIILDRADRESKNRLREADLEIKERALQQKAKTEEELG